MKERTISINALKKLKRIKETIDIRNREIVELWTINNPVVYFLGKLISKE